MWEQILQQLSRLRFVWISVFLYNIPGCENLRIVYLLIVQTDQMSRVVNELDSIHFSLKKASKLVKEIGRQVSPQALLISSLYNSNISAASSRVFFCTYFLLFFFFFSQVATDKCIMAFLFLIVIGVIAIIIVKVHLSTPFFFTLAYLLSFHILLWFYRYHTCNFVFSFGLDCEPRQQRHPGHTGPSSTSHEQTFTLEPLLKTCFSFQCIHCCCRWNRLA